MNKVNKAVFDTNAQCCDIMNHLIKEETMEEIIKIDIPKGYEFAGVDDDNKQVLFEKVKPKCPYPKNYDECCGVLFPHSIELGKVLVSGHNCELLEKLGELLICRDAYWKIVGEQMGLRKPWEPSLKSKKWKYALSNVGGKISFELYGEYNSILCFPTPEIRNTFYENFKNLIEQCKELL